MSAKISLLPTHYAFKLLQSCLGVPKLISILRCFPCHNLPELNEIDTILKGILEKVLNIQLNETKWIQASLPTRLGGLGFRSSNQLAITAYLSSFCEALKQLPSLPISIEFEQNYNIMNSSISKEIPDFSQRTIDHAICKSKYKTFVNSFDAKEKSRIMSASHKFSGDWLKLYLMINLDYF